MFFHAATAVDESVRIAAADRAGRERLLPGCARPPRTTPGRRMRAAAGTRHELADARGTPAPGATLAPQRPLITPSFPSVRVSQDVLRYFRPCRGRWIYYPFPRG